MEKLENHPRHSFKKTWKCPMSKEYTLATGQNKQTQLKQVLKGFTCSNSKFNYPPTKFSTNSRWKSHNLEPTQHILCNDRHTINIII